MAKLKSNPSKAGVSAASVKGNAGPTHLEDTNKKTSSNQQYKKHNMDHS
ncbi:YuzL family protein [Bacillus lacus]|uniref:YuzL family protein n=1 Tax=Metabacillus lacus TaxID=1983721 RepID=A0A7X2IYW0_9BACI|nr:YuzL family protein [Metabacillus lacus]MRX72027.1 YuzL family protein [Metabacillus lacus]